MQHNFVFSKERKTSISKIHSTFKLYDYFNKRLDREIKEVGAEKVAKYEKMIEGMIPLHTNNSLPAV